MAWPGLELVAQWAICLAILAWAVWFLATRLVQEFAPDKAPGCHGCPSCEPQSADGTPGCSGQCGGDATPPAAKLKSR